MPGPERLAPGEEDDWPVDRGRPLGLRLLALLGAISFVLIGLSVVIPLLYPKRPVPPPPPGGAGTTA